MRHIPLKKKKPDDAWLKKAEKLIKELEDAPDKAARDDIIDDNKKVWGELKQWLLSLSHDKCWFSEAKDCFSHFEVEHFRPKKTATDADGTTHDGYWWLAFDWRNFRICGNAGNRKKGTFFPLRSGCRRVRVGGDLRTEDPQLLDPADEDDPNLITFDVEGNAIPVPGVSTWDRTRVEYSVDRCKLDFPPLMDKRKTIWAECWSRIQAYLVELQLYDESGGTNLIARTQSKEKANAIREMIREEQELSAVARACIISSGDPRVVGLLRTA
jgi:uncharacterized protein (TIGR02646 family)